MGIVVDAFFLFKLPEHIGRLLLHVVKHREFDIEVGDVRNLVDEGVNFEFEIVIHSVKCFVKRVKAIELEIAKIRKKVTSKIAFLRFRRFHRVDCCA